MKITSSLNPLVVGTNLQHSTSSLKCIPWTLIYMKMGGFIFRWNLLNFKSNQTGFVVGLLYTSIRAANLQNTFSVFWWTNFRILITFLYPLICSSSDLKQSLWQLPIYSGGTHWLPVETLVDSFATIGTGSEEEHVLLLISHHWFRLWLVACECFGD